MGLYPQFVFLLYKDVVQKLSWGKPWKLQNAARHIKKAFSYEKIILNGPSTFLKLHCLTWNSPIDLRFSQVASRSAYVSLSVHTCAYLCPLTGTYLFISPFRHCRPVQWTVWKRSLSVDLSNVPFAYLCSASICLWTILWWY